MPRDTRSPDVIPLHRLRPIPWAHLGDLPERAYLIKGLLDRGAFSVIYGESNSGKSTLALDMGLHIALGREWRGRKVRGGGVVYIAAEGGLGVRERLEAFRLHHVVDPGRVPFSVIAASVDLRDPAADTGELIEEIKGLADETVFVVIDTLSRVLAGESDSFMENVGPFIGNVDRIRAATGAHVSAVHHSGKDQSRGARGHTSLRAAADTEIEVSNDKVTKTVTLTVTKQRDHAGGDAFAFTLIPVEIGTDEDGDPVTACIAEPSDAVPSDRRRGPRVTGGAKVALDHLRKAVDDAGEHPPASDHIPGTIRCVPLSLWRAYCYQGSVTERDNAEARRKAFNRASQRLQEIGIIGVWNDWVWIIP